MRQELPLVIWAEKRAEWSLVEADSARVALG